MKVSFRSEKCTIIKFDESQAELRRNGWLGDESEARIFKPNACSQEIRIFKDNGESYVLREDCYDPMVRMKIDKIIEFANANAK